MIMRRHRHCRADLLDLWRRHFSWHFCEKIHLSLHVTKRENVTLRNENGSERSKFAAFHTPILAPEVIAREIPFNLAAAL
jgi:hypothetical protein